MKIFWILALCILPCSAFMISPFNEWFAIDFVKNIDKSKPYAFNVGELPLVAWFSDCEHPLTTINICNHMGSRLDHGKIVNGDLLCPYHGLKHTYKQSFGKSIIFQDKLWWSYKPVKKPPAIPLYDNKEFETSFITIDIDANIIDCALNTMDVNHPAFVHNNAFGFGSYIPAQNLTMIKYPDKKKVGLSFTYTSESNLIHLKKDLKSSKNFHMYTYPYNVWSRVSLPENEHMYVNVDFLPLAPNKTRWLVTLLHNFWNKDDV